MFNSPHGRFILLTGLSGSGKTTLGQLLTNHLNAFGVRKAYLIDGDLTRSFLESSSGYTSSERDEVTKKMAFAAWTLIENNIDVVMANIAPALSTRNFLKNKFKDFIEIYLKVDFETLVSKDVKGIYKKNITKEKPYIVGKDIPYEESLCPDLILYTHKESPEESLKAILRLLTNRGPSIGTKGDTLESLRRYTKKWIIPNQWMVTWNNVLVESKENLKKTAEKLGGSLLAVRSSCRAEDSRHNSNAGAFDSLLNVEPNPEALYKAVHQVYKSYVSKKLENASEELILIQPMVQNVISSGVVFTRHEYSESPYYVINYDDTRNKTDAVTSGSGGKVLYISRNAKKSALGRWKVLIDAVQELEGFFPKFPLDIEWAINSSGKLFLLQCRPLNITNYPHSLEKEALEVIEELKYRIARQQLPIPHVPGNTTILSDMADWNPAEIIGERPGTLAYTLYRYLVTDQTWHVARAQHGYFNLINGPLMMSMARKPYIDVRIDFASFTPQNISQKVREKLVNHYLEKLMASPELHDKVEFEILYTCYDLNTEKRIQSQKFLNVKEQAEFVNSLKELTIGLIKNFPNEVLSLEKNISQLLTQVELVKNGINSQSQFWEYFLASYLLIEHTRMLGVLPFAKMARHAFVAHTLLKSLVQEEIITDSFVQDYLSQIPTIASQFSGDLEKLKQQSLSYQEFKKSYGHLRMNTYDICSLRYDQIPLQRWKDGNRTLGKGKKTKKLNLPKEKVSQLLKVKHFPISVEELESYITKAIQYREYSKFEFSKALSESLEFLAAGAKILGISREELQNVSIETLHRFRNPEWTSKSKVTNYLKSRITEKTKENTTFDLIKLPSVIYKPEDLDVINVLSAKPNFISKKSITAPTQLISNLTIPGKINLKNKIVIIENADPGYDWIFSYGIAGLVTKYGGVASHMSIRCSEFDIPGAIGCGELIYAQAVLGSQIFLDCKSEILKVL